jgi:hypothetical protein
MSSPFQQTAARVMGADFLHFLLTPECVDSAQPPTEEQWQELDFTRYGKTEIEIKQFLELKAREQSKTSVLTLTNYFYADLLNQAMDQGLIYRLNNPKEDGKAYYGVPSHVRQALALEWRPTIESIGQLSDLEPVKDRRVAMMSHLKLLLEQIPFEDDAEIDEYVAQLAINAVLQGHLSSQEVPVALQQLAQTLGLIPVPHYAGLTVLLEACRGTSLFKSVKRLCDAAVDANLLPAEDLDAVLSGKPSSPFMVLT